MTAPGPDSHRRIGGRPADGAEEPSAAKSAPESEVEFDLDQQAEDEPVTVNEEESTYAYEDESPGSDLARGSSGFQAIARLSANPDALEVFRSISQMFDALQEERRARIAADEHRRHVEVSNTRLEAELELERTLRRLAEGELARLRREEGDRRKRAQQELDRLLHDANDEIEDESAHSAEVREVETGPTETEGERSEEVAPAPAPSPPPYEQAEARPSPPPLPQAPMPEPPLPPGWRYASDVPRKRRWFAPWRGHSSEEP